MNGQWPTVSLEITARDHAGLRTHAHRLPPSTRVNITDLATEDAPTRIAAIRQVRDLGLIPIPHIAARRVHDVHDLVHFLDGASEAGAVDEFVLVAGDAASPGVFDDALALIDSGVLDGRGITRAGIGGYPEGHPLIPDEALWRALLDKRRALHDRGIATEIVTQFAFDADAVTSYVEQVREADIDDVIRIGVAGPTNARQLLRFAARFGARSSASIVRKYGFSLTNLLHTAGPEAFLTDLDRALASRHGAVFPHLYAFGGLESATAWIGSRSPA